MDSTDILMSGNEPEVTTATPAKQPLKGHTIICGMGRLGTAIAEQLHSIGEKALVIDPHPRVALLAKVERLHIPILREDCSRPEILEAAGIAHAKSLICTVDSDIINLETGLAARDLNPTIRVVLRLFSEDIAEKTQVVLQNYAALSVSKVSSPTIAIAGLCTRLRNAFRLGDHLFLIAEVEITTQRTIGDLKNATVISYHSSQQEPLLFPGPEVRLSKGDSVLLLTSYEHIRDVDLGALLPRNTLEDRTRSAIRRLELRVRSLLSALFSLDRRLAILGAVLGLIVTISMLVFTTSLHLSLIDAWYFVITTVTTVGFGDISLARAPTPIKLYGTFLMLSGAVLMASLFAIITDAIVGARISRLLGPHALPISEHFIICGVGSVGFRVLEELKRRRVPVVAIEIDPSGSFLPEVRRMGIPVLIASATRPETLRLARAENATCIICCTSNDVINIETALNARSLAPNLRVVMRLFNQSMAQKMERFFQIHSAHSAAILAAPAFAAAALDGRVIHSFVTGEQWLLVSRFIIEPGSPLIGQSLGYLRDTLQLAVLQHAPLGGSLAFHPPEHTLLAASDTIILIGNKAALAILETAKAVKV